MGDVHLNAIQMIGRYRIDASLGTGAMGEVYRAYDPVIDRPVAIKVVRPELIAGRGAEQWLQRFRREARAAGRRFHPNIIAVLDFGDDNGVPFLAMEYIDGQSLDTVIKASGPLEPTRGVPIITQVLSALGFIHKNGIVHRDVKPSNIMVFENDQIKVADFGIARIDESEFTIVGDLLGTPAYMAPEQFAGAPVDERTDLFAAGVILYEMLTGVKPFRGRSITEIMRLMEKRGPEDIGLLNPAVPEALKQVIDKALAFDPGARFASADAFAAAIAEAVVAPPGREARSEVSGSEAQQSVDHHSEIPDQLLGHPDLSFEGKGERRVKNIGRANSGRVEYEREARPQSGSRGLGDPRRRLWRTAFPLNPRSISVIGGVLLATLAAVLSIAAPTVWFNNGPVPPRASIVVMPFNNFSRNSEQGYVADALTDDITTDLARLKGIFVIARGTAFTFKGRSVDAREVGRECNVRYLLEGSIIRDGNRLETNVQLIDTQTGAHLWADRFQSDISDLFKLLSAVTGRIAASLDIQLAKAEGERVMQETATDPNAVDLRLRAVSLYISGITPEHTLEARHLLEQSVQLDPNSAEAWAELAHVLMIDYLRSWNNATTNNISLAEQAVQKAYAIDRSVALAHVAEGKIREVKGDLQGEIDALDEALALDPNLAVAYAHKANALILLGRAEEAPELLTKAVQLSPRDPDLSLFYWFMGRAFFNTKNYKAAIQWLKKSVEVRPTTWFSWAHLISAYALTGQLQEPDAKAALDEYRQRFKADWPLDPNIKRYYTQAKYRGAPRELQESLQEYFRGLQIAKQTAGFP